MSKISLSSNEYNDFLRCLSNLREVCNDVDIQGGFIRQRSTDKTSVFEIDLSSILGDTSFTLTALKKKFDLLKSFSGQDVTIETSDEKKNYIFSDNFSSLKIESPIANYVDNKYMSAEEIDCMFNIQDDELILEHDLSGIITDRIRITTSNFDSNAIRVQLEGEHASIKTSTQSKDQFATFVSDIPTNMILEDSSVFISKIPFGIDHDTDVKLKMFRDPNKNDIASTVFITTLGSFDIKIYTRSTIIGDDD